jgi:uncharacterized protein (DUF952 family)
MALIHLLSRTEWERARESGIYAPPSLATEGFLHLCTEEQVSGVLARFFAGRDDVVALHLDEAKLSGEVRWEDSYGHGVFPHLYAPLNHEAIVRVTPA